MSILLSIIIVAITIKLIYQKAKAQIHDMMRAHHVHSEQQLIEASTFAKLVAVQVLTLLASWSGTAMFVILGALNARFGEVIDSESLHSTVIHLADLSFSFGTAVNFIFYIAISKSFRQTFLGILRSGSI